MCIYMDKTGCTWICVISIRLLIVNLTSPQKTVEAMLILSAHKLPWWRPRPAWSKVRAPLQGCEREPDWIPYSAPRTCDPGQASSPHLADEGTERLIPQPAPTPGIAKPTVLHQHKTGYYSKLDSNQWEGQRDAWTSILPILCTKNWMNICQHPASFSKTIHLWDSWMRSGRGGEEFTLSPLNQRLSCWFIRP